MLLVTFGFNYLDHCKNREQFEEIIDNDYDFKCTYTKTPIESIATNLIGNSLIKMGNFVKYLGTTTNQGKDSVIIEEWGRMPFFYQYNNAI